ncbi:hypothetical protein B0J14DRAFT_114496 [Halenospora varia]|nr:hypothetical protein B0J14DRAFT_114496 [Halenospora varia]
MDSLKVIPYQYVPTKPRRRSEHPSASIGVPFNARHDQQRIEQGSSPQKALQVSTSGVPRDARAAGEPGRHESVQGMTIGEPSGEGVRERTVFPSVEASSGGSVLVQDALGWEIGNNQFEVTDSGAINLDTFFSGIDVDSYFEEPGAGLVFKSHGIHNAGQHEEAFTRLICESIPDKEPSRRDVQHQGAMRNRIGRRVHPSPVITCISSEDGNGDESVFESSQPGRTKSCSRNGTPGSSINDNDNDEDTAESPTTHLNDHPESPVLHLAKHCCISAESPRTSNPAHVADPPTEDDDPESSDDEDELLHSPAWYRFGPGAATTESPNTIRDTQRPYVTRVKDAWLDREFHGLLGKEFINGELHYLVDFTPLLIRASVVRKARAQPLIDSFEARCQVHTKRQRHEEHQSHEPVDDRPQRKRRGRPRKSV